jgi:hypothetical protein
MTLAWADGSTRAKRAASQKQYRQSCSFMRYSALTRKGKEVSRKWINRKKQKIALWIATIAAIVLFAAQYILRLAPV